MDPIQGDLEDSASLNRYAYVLNNPPNLVDPFGLRPIDYYVGFGVTVRPDQGEMLSHGYINFLYFGFFLQNLPTTWGSGAAQVEESELSRLDRLLSSIPIEGTRDDYERCLEEDPLISIANALSPLPLANLKSPGELRKGASLFTSLDRRVPTRIRLFGRTVSTGANPAAGATVTRGAVGRLKFVGRYGTAAAAAGTFGLSYSTTARYRCFLSIR